MAISNSLAQTTALLGDLGPQLVQDGLTKQTTFYRSVPQVMGGDARGPRQRVEISANDSVGGFTPGGALPAAGGRVTAEAYEDWGAYQGSIAFTEKQLIQMESNQMLIKSEVQGQIDSMTESMGAVIDADMISGTAANRIIGMNTAVSDAGTYFNLSRVTYATSWASYVAANGGSGRAISTDVLNAAYNYHKYTIGGNVTVGVCGYAGLNALKELSSGQVLTTNANIDAGSPNASKYLGYNAVFLNGTIPIIAMPGWTAGEIVFFDESKLQMYMLKAPSLCGEPVQDGDQFIWTFTVYLQMMLTNPRKTAFAIDDLNA